jgi:hypothetical protein
MFILLLMMMMLLLFVSLFSFIFIFISMLLYNFKKIIIYLLNVQGDEDVVAVGKKQLQEFSTMHDSDYKKTSLLHAVLSCARSLSHSG